MSQPRPSHPTRTRMNLPFEYERVTLGEFGGTDATTTDFDNARVVILPIPLDRTTSYVPGTRTGPHEILVASSHMELWDEETADRRPRHRHLHAAGDGVSVRDDGRGDAARFGASRRELVDARQVSRSSSAASTRSPRRWSPPSPRRHKNLSVLQIDAHADLRDSFMGTPHNHACAMRRTLEHARSTQVGIRSLSTEEAAAHPVAAHDDLLRLQHAAGRATGWIASSTRSARRSTSRSTATDSIRRSCRRPARRNRAG